MKKSPESIRRVGLIANPEKVMCHVAVQRAADLIRESGRAALTDPATARMARLDLPQSTDSAGLARDADLLLVFGGDGTMLRVAREVAGSRTPILGINVGGLGFLTAVPSDLLPKALEFVWTGQYDLEPCPLLTASCETTNGPVEQVALNDFVLGRGAPSRMIELEVSVDGQVLTCYRCDGLIVSSPRGSTAYSLSAGGAVVCPDAAVFALTPICPHTLSNRSVIVNLASTVQVKVMSQKLETILTADGQVQSILVAGGVVTIRRSRRKVYLVQLAGSSFFATLRQKLSWSGSNV
ncbi:MAG: NAD(+)/NADH kinase [Candidatus Omnitrophica bacterium]|nr:NAD(+)/NADH kinase [Candidatus Omnitrophota bacterium]